MQTTSPRFHKRLLSMPILVALLWLPLSQCLSAQLPTAWQTIVLDRNTSPVVAEAADVLADLLAKEFNQRPVVRPSPLFGNPRGIRIRTQPDHPLFNSDRMQDEFIIEHHATNWFIIGKDNPTTAFAVYRFIESFLGWYLFHPGPHGMEKAGVNLPDDPAGYPLGILQHERAGFVSRNFSGLREIPPGPRWMQWQGLRERFQYNHTLHRIVTPEFFDTHPEWFAKDRDGSPMRPPFPIPHGYNDHPDLSSPAVRDWHLQHLIATLQDRHGFRPDAQSLLDAGVADPATFSIPAPRQPRTQRTHDMISVSLGLGDSFIFGQFAHDYPLRARGFFRRWPDWSPLVFDYSNELVTRLLAASEQGRWPDSRPPEIFFGVLAYLTWENVPNFPVHPQIVPYLTFDRSQWYDPAARADDLANVERWASTGTHFLGTWDYLFGSGFLIPRSMTGIVADSIPALHQRGVSAYFSQIGPIWPFDGHTTWLAARLLWDPHADADALLDIYFNGMYGAAATHVRAFMDLAEARWMQQTDAGWWLRYWRDPWHAALYLDDNMAILTAMQQHLHAAQTALADAPERFQIRIHELQVAFALTDAFVRYMDAVWRLQADWQKLLRRGAFDQIAALAEAALIRRNLLQHHFSVSLKDYPRLQQMRDSSWVFLYDTLRGSITAALHQLLIQGNPVDAPAVQRLHLVMEALDPDLLPALQPVTTSPTQLLVDPDFRNLGKSPAWRIQQLQSEGLTFRANAEGGLVVGQSRRSSAHQLFSAQKGDFFISSIDFEGQQSPTGQIYIQLQFFNGDAEMLAETPRARIAPSAFFGQRQNVFTAAVAPPQTVFGRLFIRFYEMDPGTEITIHRAEVLAFPAR